MGRPARAVSGIPLLGSAALAAGCALGGPVGFWPTVVGVAVDPAGPVGLMLVLLLRRRS